MDMVEFGLPSYLSIGGYDCGHVKIIIFFRLFLLVLTYQESIKIAPNGTCPATVSVCKCLASKALSNAKAICQFSRLRQAFIAEL